MQRMEYKIANRKIPVCLECGDKIRYGRTDKKFCCDECRMKYHHEQVKSSKTYKRRILSMLSRNYDILENLIRSGVESVDLLELEGLGFIPGVVTSYLKVNKHDEYTCFDIKYIMTPTRVTGIKKISLNLQVRKNIK
ncbi:MAG: hypothetical protein IKW11_01415 [Bacteroidales bacterium]|nr:hypothetical protein [Bacteroidales bacterium]